MKPELVKETDELEHYLQATAEIDYDHPCLAGPIAELRQSGLPDEELIRRAFELVRDHISHSWDIQSERITKKASEVWQHREGICYAKSLLLAALLRGAGIPAGLCYQRLTLGDTPETGYCIHALNAVYLRDRQRWVRLDARGNKAGIEALFSIDEEKLAFPVRTEMGEIDYPIIYANPHPVTMQALHENTNCLHMYERRLPAEL